MKKTLILILATALALLLVLTACSKEKPTPEQNIYITPKLVLNGEELDVYTLHYEITEEYAKIPLTAFLHSIGAEYASSPLNTYGTQSYSFMGKRYVVVPNLHLFMLEDDYKVFVQKLENENKELSQETTADCGLLPKKNSIIPEVSNGTVLESAEIWVDHISLMNALIKSGIDITIEYDYSAQSVNVTLPQQDN